MTRQQEPMAAPLKGWRIETLPDGCMSVRKAKMAGDIPVLVTALVMLALLGFAFFMVLHALEPGSFRFWFLLSILVLASPCIMWCVWTARGKTEWYVSHDLLKVRLTIFGCSRERRYAGSGFRIYFKEGAEGVGGSWHLGLTTSSGERGLASGCLPRSLETLRYLGVLLSERTGWPLQMELG